MDTTKYKKVTISARLSADSVEKLRMLAIEKNCLMTELMQVIVDNFFNNDPAAPVEQKECIVLEDMKLETVAAIMECSDQLQLSYPETIDLLFERVMEQAGRVDAEWIEKAKAKLAK